MAVDVIRMMNQDPVVTVAVDLAALAFAWIVGALVFRVLRVSWRISAIRALGLALVSLASLLFLRLLLPDLFVLPLVFLAAIALDVGTSMHFSRPRERIAVSALVSLCIVGSLVLVDHVLRITGSRLTVGG